jgi:hypothetical protein
VVLKCGNIEDQCGVERLAMVGVAFTLSWIQRSAEA